MRISDLIERIWLQGIVLPEFQHNDLLYTTHIEGRQGMTYLEDYLEITPARIRLKGHRIGLEQLVHAYHAGATAEDMARDFPGLSLESIYAALTYYLRNHSAVEAYIAGLEAESDSAYASWAADPPAVVRRLRSTRIEEAPPEA